MSAPVFDVVVVPDFAGPGHRIFEARTLLFLGSWLEHSGRSRTWPLHLVSVGEPPPGVAELAARCGARVSQLPELTVRGQRFLNKLRGLEIESTTGQILLLDADTVVLRDLAPAAAGLDGFAALVAATNRIPCELWEELFTLAGTRPPQDRILPLIAQLEDRLPKSVMREPFRDAIPAHYNSGVLVVPADCRLREHWERVARLLDERYAGVDDQHEHIVRNDQPSLAVATALLRDDGIAVRSLPYPLHGFDLLYAAGVLEFDQTAVYHAKTFFRRDKKAAVLDPLHEVTLYRESQVPRLYPETRIERWGRSLRGRSHPRRAASILRLCARMEELTRRYVLPELS
jgi:hypothetical protein